MGRLIYTSDAMKTSAAFQLTPVNTEHLNKVLIKSERGGEKVVRFREYQTCDWVEHSDLEEDIKRDFYSMNHSHWHVFQQKKKLFSRRLWICQCVSVCTDVCDDGEGAETNLADGLKRWHCENHWNVHICFMSINTSTTAVTSHSDYKCMSCSKASSLLRPKM